MSNEIEVTNEITKRKSEIIKAVTDIEFYPTIMEEQICVEKYTKLPLSQVTTFGTAFEPLTAAFQKVINGGGTSSGLYQVTIPKGAHLAEFKNGSGYLGSVLKKNGAVGGGQAILNPLVCNPTMLFIAATLAAVDKKLDNIQEIQRELFDFLVQKERSDLRGDLNFLTGVLNDYKYNWNNITFRNSNYNIVLDVRRKASRKISFCRERLNTEISKQSFFHKDQWVKKQLGKIESDFIDYQLALYLYSFSSFLEIVLLENFKAEYLNDISKKIEDHSLEYSELYIKCYGQIEKYTQSSLQSKLYKGATSVSRGMGYNLAMERDVKKLLGETLVFISDKVENKRSERTEQTMKQFLEKQNDYTQPFLENIKTVNKLYNQPIELIFDKENIYIGR